MADNKLNRKEIVNNINNVIAKLNVLSSSDTSVEKRDQYKACIYDIMIISSVIDERLEKLDLLENYFKLFDCDLDKALGMITQLVHYKQLVHYTPPNPTVPLKVINVQEMDDKKGV